MIYFAYGSNMDPAQMGRRCVGARAQGIGCLADHRLTFPRWSNIREHAVASVEPSLGDAVWGVLYAMTAADWESLHRREGFFGPGNLKNGYDLRSVKVVNHVELVAAKTYVANVNPKRPEPGLTSTHYLGQIINGAIKHGLPDAYVAQLRAVPTCD